MISEPTSLRIRHVINTVGPDAPGRLLVPQELTLESIERAISLTGPSISVDVVSVSFREEPTPRPWMLRGPDLRRSLLDLGEFPGSPPLPLLGDILDGFGDDGDWDLGVFTNLDIAVQPLFYELVAEIARRGFDAFTINRRVVDRGPHGSGLAWKAAQVGFSHPGFDCFVFTPQVFESIDVADTVVGAPFIGRALIANLALAADRFHSFTDLQATFHFGADERWRSEAGNAVREHNRAAMQTTIRRLESIHGTARVRNTPQVARFLRWSNSGGDTEHPPATASSAVTDTRARSRNGSQRRSRREPQRLVLIADPGQTTAERLAEIIATAPDAHLVKEPLPRRTGELLRRIGSEDPSASYAERLQRADTIRTTLEMTPPGHTVIDPNPMFLSTFADVVLDSFDTVHITVVVTRRPLTRLITEALEDEWFIRTDGAWIDRSLPPTVPMSMFPIDAAEIESPVDLVIGHHLGETLRLRRLQADHTRCRWLELDPIHLTAANCVRPLLDSLHLTPTPQTWRTVAALSLERERSRRSIGARSVRTGFGIVDIDDALRSFHRRFHERISAAGLDTEFRFDEELL